MTIFNNENNIISRKINTRSTTLKQKKDEANINHNSLVKQMHFHFDSENPNKKIRY